MVGCALFLGRRNKGLIDKLLVIPIDRTQGFELHDYHIESVDDAKTAVRYFHDICEKDIVEKKKSHYCMLALEEIVFNIVDYQTSAGDPEINIDVHIVLYGNGKMVMRVKDCSKERNPFVKYERSDVGDDMDNLGIKILKSIAEDIKYSFVYGVNFITITV